SGAEGRGRRASARRRRGWWRPPPWPAAAPRRPCGPSARPLATWRAWATTRPRRPRPGPPWAATRRGGRRRRATGPRPPAS
ncbi:unnamed protein product, partial [Prorocentrum cordatum]